MPKQMRMEVPATSVRLGDALWGRKVQRIDFGQGKVLLDVGDDFTWMFSDGDSLNIVRESKTEEELHEAQCKNAERFIKDYAEHASNWLSVAESRVSAKHKLTADLKATDVEAIIKADARKQVADKLIQDLRDDTYPYLFAAARLLGGMDRYFKWGEDPLKCTSSSVANLIEQVGRYEWEEVMNRSIYAEVIHIEARKLAK